MREYVARLGGAVGIDGFPAFVDVPDDAILVDDEGGPIPKPLIFVKDSIVLHYRSFEVA